MIFQIISPLNLILTPRLNRKLKIKKRQKCKTIEHPPDAPDLGRGSYDWRALKHRKERMNNKDNKKYVTALVHRG